MKLYIHEHIQYYLFADCEILSNPVNGNVTMPVSITYGEAATYSCDSGYDINGVSSRICQADGTWSAVEPTCEPKSKLLHLRFLIIANICQSVLERSQSIITANEDSFCRRSIFNNDRRSEECYNMY